MEHLCRILIVDDESILRHGLKHLCNWEEEGFFIIGEAANGEQALQMIEDVKPHIIITDVVMPIMDGVEFSKIVHDLYPDIKIIVLSSFSEFDYVKEAFKHGVFDYLLKAKLNSSELLEILKKVRTQTPWNKDEQADFGNIVDISNILAMLMDGYLLAGDPKINMLGNHFTKQHFVMLACNLGLLGAAQKNVSKLSQHYLSAYTYSNIFLEDKYILLINFDDNNNITQDMDQFTRSLKSFSSPTVFITSHHFMDIQNTLEVYRSIAELLPKTFYFYNHHLVHMNILLKTNKLSDFDSDLFTTHIKNLDFQSAYDCLEIYFNNAKTSLALDDYSLKRFCQNIIYSTLSICDELGFDTSEINNSKIRMFKTIDLATSSQNLKTIVFDILNKIADSINLQVDQTNSTMINQIKRYVDEHYSHDISLTDISNQLHINYYYMSSYFKAHTNENLSTYINKIRVEKAKSLLQDKTIPIAHISEMVGFSEHNYFSKVFKKYTKLTPTAYRRKVIE